MKSGTNITRVHKGLVDLKKPYFELRYGSIHNDEVCLLAALVGFPDVGIVNVDLLLKGHDARESEITAAIWRDVEFFLIELGESDPWLYAQYHCSTCSNVYDKVHWSYVPTTSFEAQEER